MIDPKFITFLSLCETRNYTKTAELLYITQPSVTNHIKTLEKTYNIKLFVSNSRSFNLTPEGELLYKYVLQLKAMDLQFERLLTACGNRKAHVTIGVTKNINHSLLKYILPRFTKDNPDLSYCLNVGEYEGIIDDLNNGLIDFAIIDNRFTKKSYQVLPLVKTKLILGVNKKHPLASKTKISFEELSLEKVVLDINGTGKRDFLESQLKMYNRSIKDVGELLEINCPVTTLNFVLDSNYVGVFYECEIEDEIRSGKIVPINILEVKNDVDFSLIYIKNHLSAKLIEDIGMQFKKIYYEINYLKYTSS